MPFMQALNLQRSTCVCLPRAGIKSHCFYKSKKLCFQSEQCNSYYTTVMIWTAFVGIVWSGGIWNVQGMLAVCGEVTKATQVTATRNPWHYVVFGFEWLVGHYKFRSLLLWLTFVWSPHSVLRLCIYTALFRRLCLRIQHCNFFLDKGASLFSTTHISPKA